MQFVEGGTVFLAAEVTTATVEAPGLTEKSVILLTQGPSAEEFRSLRVSAKTPGKNFTIKATLNSGNKFEVYWMVFN
jgi:hypothetical protein